MTPDPAAWVIKCTHGHRAEAGEQLLNEARAELAALKARRCDGCAWYGCGPGNPFGRCIIAERTDAAMCVGPGVLHVRPDHACNAWTAQP